jgi:hypothetical protein
MSLALSVFPEKDEWARVGESAALSQSCSQSMAWVGLLGRVRPRGGGVSSAVDIDVGSRQGPGQVAGEGAEGLDCRG